MSQQQHRQHGQEPEEIATYMGMGFVYHDKRRREMAIESFARVDEFQFQHLNEQQARKAATAYVDALWAKDEVENACRVGGEIDPEAADAADWTPVREAFARRASIVGMDPEYAELSTVAWRRHKTGGDYWTPLQKAQMYELRAALQDSEYPHKPRNGQSGFGPEPVRYVLGVELHDTRRYEEGVDAMAPYFERIANDRRERNSNEWQV